MPELPEVEALRRGLEKFVVNQKIKTVDILTPKFVWSKSNVRVENPEKVNEFIQGVTGKKIKLITRRAKNLIIQLEDRGLILVHLKMTGQLVFQSNEQKNSTSQNIHKLVSFSSQGKVGMRSKGWQAEPDGVVLQANLQKNTSPTKVGIPQEENLFWGGHPIELTENELPNKHTGIIFELENGKLFYNDTRKFGYVLYYKNQEELEKENHFVNLGMEPLDFSPLTRGGVRRTEGFGRSQSETGYFSGCEKQFTLENFGTELKKQSGIIKKVFLEQKVVVGLGNIYADEVCFEAGVKPQRKASSLTKKEIEKLYNAIKRILPRAVELGGSSVANYLLADGKRGNYAREHKVYKRGKKECLVCGSTLQSDKVAGRTTVWCEVCQS